jgi:hypothetical protein
MTEPSQPGHPAVDIWEQLARSYDDPPPSVDLSALGDATDLDALLTPDEDAMQAEAERVAASLSRLRKREPDAGEHSS